MARPTTLPKPASTLVLKSLQQAKKPLSAYEILDLLKSQGVKSPPIVYRALKGLIKKGKIHRLDHLNAYLACSHDHAHAVSIIAICGSCNSTNELHDKQLTNHIKKLENFGLTLPYGAVLEVPVVCTPCQGQPA